MGTYHKGSGEPAHKRSLARAFAVRRYIVEILMKLHAKKRMFVAQIGECTSAFEEPHTGKTIRSFFRVSAHLQRS